MTDSIVEYVYEPGGPGGYKCGYCKSPNTSYTQGVWGYRMSCLNFQRLVDRGFQRSGNFVYKPVMKKTCCPQYVIRMDATKFKISKSQRASIKKFKQYLLKGRKQPTPESEMSTEVNDDKVSAASGELVLDPSGTCVDRGTSVDIDMPTQAGTTTPTQSGGKAKKVVKPGVGPDPNKPPCKKAKLIRKERKQQKLLAQAQKKVIQNASEMPTTVNAPKQEEKGTDLKELLTFPNDEECVHKFRTRLIQINPSHKEYIDSYEESYQVFKKFQTVVHKESEEDSGERQFIEFLINTPLIYEKGSEKMTVSYGTYHQQYILDDKIFAVGVLDIIPKGVVCEYLYYDPDYRFIHPGVITALLEIMLTQQFCTQNPDMQYYYMGFYVQSCPKMNYKRRYSASSLLCTETFTYVPLEECIPKLTASPYSRLAAQDVKDASVDVSSEELGSVLVYSSGMAMTYSVYCTHKGDHATSLVEEYVKLVGLEVARDMKVNLRSNFRSNVVQ